MTQYSLPPLLLTKCVGVFPHQAILQFSADTEKVSYKFNSIRTLPRDSNRANWLRAQSHKTSPPASNTNHRSRLSPLLLPMRGDTDYIKLVIFKKQKTWKETLTFPPIP